MVSRLKERIHQGYVGWQWDDGPVFVGEDSRKWAVMWGKSCMYQEELLNLSVLAIRYEQTKSDLKTLQAKKEMLDG